MNAKGQLSRHPKLSFRWHLDSVFLPNDGRVVDGTGIPSHRGAPHARPECSEVTLDTHLFRPGPPCRVPIIFYSARCFRDQRA